MSTTLGQKLRSERESRRVSLDDVAAATKIRLTYLTALEENELAELPGAVFGKGYVRAYAGYLGVDPDALLRAYDRQERRRHGPENADVGDVTSEMRRLLVPESGPGSSSRRSRRRAIVLSAVALAAVAAASAGAALWARRAIPGMPAVAPSVAPSVEPVVVAPPAPAPVPAPPRRATPKPVPRLSIESAALGRRVVGRQVVDRTDRFQEGSRAVFWTLVERGKPGDTIRHVWFRDGEQRAAVPLRIGSDRWRTYSRYLLSPGDAGPWSVEVRDSAGTVLERAEFVCVPRQVH